MAAAPWKKRLLIAMVFLNPYFTKFFAEGRNDILPFFLILLAVRLAGKGRGGLSLAVMSLATATKQFTWFFLPFFFLMMAGSSASNLSVPELLRSGLARWRQWLVFPLVVCVLILPFLFWDFHAFVDDILLFNAGRSESNYPLGGTPGFGAANLVLYLQLVENREAYFPFIIPIVLVVVPLLLLLLALQRHRNRSSTMLAAGSLIFLVVLFFSRLFHDNHLGLALMWLTVACLADDFAVDDT